MKRAELNRQISLKEFQDNYWLKKELVEFCRQIGICTSGGKLELAQRIAVFLESGEIITQSENSRPRPGSKFDWKHADLNAETVITDNYKNTENVRAFFVEELGKHFKFNVAFMTWMKENPGKTLGDALEAWKRIAKQKKAPGYQNDIAPQFEYNTYIRDFLADNPGLSTKDAIQSWKLKREKPGSHRYEKSDLT